LPLKLVVGKLDVRYSAADHDQLVEVVAVGGHAPRWLGLHVVHGDQAQIRRRIHSDLVLRAPAPVVWWPESLTRCTFLFKLAPTRLPAAGPTAANHRIPGRLVYRFSLVAGALAGNPRHGIPRVFPPFFTLCDNPPTIAETGSRGSNFLMEIKVFAYATSLQSLYN
jgi:hypothetical protein